MEPQTYNVDITAEQMLQLGLLIPSQTIKVAGQYPVRIEASDGHVVLSVGDRKTTAGVHPSEHILDVLRVAILAAKKQNRDMWEQVRGG